MFPEYKDKVIAIFKHGQLINSSSRYDGTQALQSTDIVAGEEIIKTEICLTPVRFYWFCLFSSWDSGLDLSIKSSFLCAE